MISSLEYLDNDVSCLLNEYINHKKNYDKIIKDINQLIEINMFAKYLTSFHACKGILIKDRLKISKELLINKKRKINYIYNWPTKLPTFVKYKPEELYRLNNEDFIIKETGWKLKKYPPPNKKKYKLNNLLMI